MRAAGREGLLGLVEGLVARWAVGLAVVGEAAEAVEAALWAAAAVAVAIAAG